MMKTAQIRYMKRLRAVQNTHKAALREEICIAGLREDEGKFTEAAEIRAAIELRKAEINRIEKQILDYRAELDNLIHSK